MGTFAATPPARSFTEDKPKEQNILYLFFLKELQIRNWEETIAKQL